MLIDTNVIQILLYLILFLTVIVIAGVSVYSVTSKDFASVKNGIIGLFSLTGLYLFLTNFTETISKYITTSVNNSYEDKFTKLNEEYQAASAKMDQETISSIQTKAETYQQEITDRIADLNANTELVIIGLVGIILVCVLFFVAFKIKNIKSLAISSLIIIFGFTVINVTPTIVESKVTIDQINDSVEQITKQYNVDLKTLKEQAGITSDDQLIEQLQLGDYSVSDFEFNAYFSIIIDGILYGSMASFILGAVFIYRKHKHLISSIAVALYAVLGVGVVGTILRNSVYNSFILDKTKYIVFYLIFTILLVAIGFVIIALINVSFLSKKDEQSKLEEGKSKEEKETDDSDDSDSKDKDYEDKDSELSLDVESELELEDEVIENESNEYEVLSELEIEEEALGSKKNKDNK